MIFMTALLLRVCQIKAYNTELATTSPCMALIENHDSETHWTSTLDIANEIHDLIMIFMIGLDSNSACLLLLKFWPNILDPLTAIRVLIGNTIKQLKCHGHKTKKRQVLKDTRCR